MITAASRELAGIEKALRYIDDVAPFNVVVVLGIDGEFPVAQLQPAFAELQRRHPMLRSRIAAKSGGYCFHFDSALAVPVRVEEAPAGGWVEVAEKELHARLDLASGPPVRCRYLRGPAGGDLVLTLHHSMVDGVSAGYLLRELLALCAGQTPELPAGAPPEGAQATQSLYPPRYSGVGFARAAAAFMGRQMSDEARFRWRSRGVRRAPIAASSRCAILPAHYDAALTAAIFDATRRQRITLNAILGAALLRAVERRLYHGATVPLRHITFTDIRPHLRTSVPACMLGCHIAMFRFTVMVDRDGDFWALARSVQESTMRAARSGERFISDSVSPAMMKMIRAMNAVRMSATALSYTGPLNLPPSYGAFAVTGVHGFTTNFSLGPEYSALVHLFRGELWCDMLYLDSDMDKAGAQRIADEMQAILEEAVC